MGLTTSIICEACGSIQPTGGAFCSHCGAELTPGAIARALSRSNSEKAGSLQLIEDGGEAGRTYRLDRNETVIGRAEGDVTFPHDGFMSGRHARIIRRDGRYFLVDEGSRNGSFIRIHEEIELEPGDTLLIGKQVLRFDTK
jgi:pSer/pThr/pTyr-binding forkhead associated (FHA) protein